MKRIMLALALILGSLGAAEAQVSTCPLTTQAKIVSASSYTLQTSDKCLLVVLTATGTINVVLPAPGLIFAPGFYTTLFPLNGGTLSMTGMADDAGKLHKINQQDSYVFGAAQGANLSVLQDFNWWGVPTGAAGGGGSGTVTSVTFTGDGTVLSSTPSAAVTTTGTLTAALKTQSVNRVLAGPTSGPDALPTFRQLACGSLSNAGAACQGSASGNTSTFLTTTGTLTTNHLAIFDSSGNIIDGGVPSTVSSVGLSVPSASIFAVSGSPVTGTGTLGLLTNGTSGGIPYFSSTSQLNTSAALTANAPVIGGGAGAAPTVGTKSGNTTVFATAGGSFVSGNLVKADASGNLVDGGNPPNMQRLAIGWPAAIDPANNVIATIDQASTLIDLRGTVATPVGATATMSVYKAPSGTACSAGTVLHSGSFNANGTAQTNQTLTVTTTALSAGDRLCLVTTSGSNWTSGVGIGGVTARITTP